MNGRGTYTGCKLMSKSMKEASAAPEYGDEQPL